MMRPKFLFLLILFLSPSLLFAQKHVRAIRTVTPPVIDGELTEAFWKGIEPARDFVQFDPYNGQPATQKTEAFFAYDDNALYVGIMLYDSAPDSLFSGLCMRDQVDNANAEMISVDLSPFSDGQNGYEFKVSSSGVLSDIKYSPAGEDRSWNPVWQAAVRIHKQGWSAEFRIPFTAIRFPDKPEQKWSMNMWRHERRNREWSTWNFIDQKVDGVFNQMGILEGISNIKPPLRLSFTPYISGYLEHYPYNLDGVSNWSRSLNGGMDIKYGLNESFTLDMTLIPDFGQVQSDNLVMNLSPYETRYTENRPFFTEGTELFSKAGLFYSRRIGGIRNGYENAVSLLDTQEVLVNVPGEAQLINASKLSGRTNRKLGIGVFNAMAANTYATIRDTISGSERKALIQPFTNYNILVFDQAFSKNNYISLINTNVFRDQGEDIANVTGSEFYLTGKKNKYAFSGSAAMSHLLSRDSSDFRSGYKYNLSYGKTAGNLRYGVSHYFMDDRFDINDLGYLSMNNNLGGSAYISYNQYKPFWKYFLNSYNSFSLSYSRLYNPSHYTGFSLYLGSHSTLKNYLSLGLSASYAPVESYDYFEPRTPGRFYVKPQSLYYSAWFSSDYRKFFALDGHVGSGRAAHGFSDFWWGLSPRFQPGARTLLVWKFNSSSIKNDRGYADTDSLIIFGNRNIRTLINELSITYIFSKDIALSLRARHYWSSVLHQWFYYLNEQGNLVETSYNENKNINLNYFNVDLVFTWRFAPGSDLNLVWKNNVQNYQNSILYDYHENLSNTLNAPQTNSLSLKILYYIDYSSLKRKKNSG